MVHGPAGVPITEETLRNGAREALPCFLKMPGTNFTRASQRQGLRGCAPGWNDELAMHGTHVWATAADGGPAVPLSLPAAGGKNFFCFSLSAAGGNKLRFLLLARAQQGQLFLTARFARARFARARFARARFARGRFTPGRARTRPPCEARVNCSCAPAYF